MLKLKQILQQIYIQNQCLWLPRVIIGTSITISNILLNVFTKEIDKIVIYDVKLPPSGFLEYPLLVVCVWCPPVKQTSTYKRGWNTAFIFRIHLRRQLLKCYPSHSHIEFFVFKFCGVLLYILTGIGSKYHNSQTNTMYRVCNSAFKDNS